MHSDRRLVVGCEHRSKLMKRQIGRAEMRILTPTYRRHWHFAAIRYIAMHQLKIASLVDVHRFRTAVGGYTVGLGLHRVACEAATEAFQRAGPRLS